MGEAEVRMGGRYPPHPLPYSCLCIHTLGGAQLATGAGKVPLASGKNAWSRFLSYPPIGKNENFKGGQQNYLRSRRPKLSAAHFFVFLAGSNFS